jgi:acetoacetyl-CoA reductase
MSKQRVVLVTGGMGGLGETISTKMADAGYKVVVTYSPGNTKHAEWVAGMKAKGYDILAVACDVADFDSCAKAVAELHGKVDAVDVLVNNAGITRDATFKKMAKVDWDAVMRTNLDSLFNMTKQVADGMAERGWGRIINIRRSTAPRAHSARNYSAAKAGVHGFTKSLRSRWRRRTSP